MTWPRASLIGEKVWGPTHSQTLAQVSARLGKVESALNFLARALEAGYKPSGSEPTLTDNPAFASLPH